MTYLRYSDDIETPEPDEQESIDGIIKGMTGESQTVEKRDGQPAFPTDRWKTLKHLALPCVTATSRQGRRDAGQNGESGKRMCGS